jgi:hypothetical protein
MDIAQLLNALVLAADVIVVEPPLPNVRRRGSVDAVRTANGQHPTRKAELQSLHDDRRITLFRFAEQKMKVFRHDYVTQHYEAVTLSHVFQNSEKKIAALFASQQSLSAIATAGDEVQVSATVKPF